MGAEAMSPSVRKAKVREIRHYLAVIERVPCQFWACHGPSRIEAMCTCYICCEIFYARRRLKRLGF